MPEARRDLSNIYVRLGALALTRRDLDAAGRRFERCRELTETLAHEVGTPEARELLALNYAYLGDLAGISGDLDAAGCLCEQSMELTKALADELGTPAAYRLLSVSYHKLGHLALARSDLDVAGRWFEQGLKIATTLARELGTPEARADLARSQFQRAGLALLCQDFEPAVALMRAALETRRALHAEHPTAHGRAELIASLTGLLPLTAMLEGTDTAALIEDLVGLAGGAVLAGETSGQVLTRATALVSSALAQAVTETGDAARVLAEARRLFESVQNVAAPMEAAVADACITMNDILCGVISPPAAHPARCSATRSSCCARN